MAFQGGFSVVPELKRLRHRLQCDNCAGLSPNLESININLLNIYKIAFRERCATIIKNPQATTFYLPILILDYTPAWSREHINKNTISVVRVFFRAARVASI